mgnify:CR=1 FL=1
MKRRRGNGRKIESIDFDGSPRTEGNTTIAIHEMEHVFEENGVEYETIQVGKMDIRGCADAEHVIKTESVCLMIS